mgnify:CR=1 FL=1
MRKSISAGIVCGVAMLCGLSGCKEEPVLQAAGQPQNVVAWYTYAGDIEVSKDKVSASVKKEDAQDAKGNGALSGRFPTQIDAFQPGTLVTLGGGASDGQGFGASGQRSYYPDKITPAGNKLKHKIVDYGFKCGGYPSVGGIGMSINEGFISFMVKGKSKPDDGDYFDWKQYVPYIQAALGIGSKGNGLMGVGITTQVTINANLTISVTGYSKRAKGIIGETHTINSPVIFSAKNGKLSLSLPDAE